ncbi:alginate lyase family protein [Priestia megaterium]|uniref:alginate lyase family protein n=1 Tax=Priestia megaterium TaxID=1404 RepID=UPI0025B06236|nr:alginate lyase family protein [Priestia megaterium]MDN3233466.1 alginate lyase family protein [Priestia megaterium]
MESFPFSEIMKRDKVEIFRLVPLLNDDKLIKKCNDLLNNTIRLHSRFPTIDLNEDNIWLMDPCDRSWRFGLHSLSFLEYLIDAYEVTKNSDYINKALGLIWDWKKHNSPMSEADMAWHDHSTALRLITICKVYELWRENNWEEEVYKKFIELAEIHCSKLTDPNFYMKKHNHGMDQDIALTIASVIFPHLPESADWKSIATNRFKEQVNHLFASDGSYFEHSPDYVNMLVIRLFNFLSFIKKNKIDDNGYLEKVLTKAMKFLTYILQPDGQIPPIGDSVMQPIDTKKFKVSHPELLKNIEYVCSNGTKGEQPEELDIIFPEGGYAILRNKWEFDEKTVQSVFYSSFHSRVHKHHDDLSVTIFGHNQPILVDSGKYNYVYDSSERQYVISTKAHNTVVVDNENPNTSRNNIGKSGLTGYYLDKNFSFVSGTHCLYPGVIHQRLFLYLKPFDFVIIDNLLGYKEHSFEQNFHFDPSVICKCRNNTVTGYIEEKPVISLKQLHRSNDTSINLLKGVEENLLGWVSQSYAEFEPTFCATSHQSGSEARFATHVSLNPSNPLNINLKWEDDIVNVNWNNNNLKMIMATNQTYLVLNEQFLNMNYINQPKIKEAIRDQKNYEYREKYRSERKRRLRYYDELTDIKKSLQE